MKRIFLTLLFCLVPVTTTLADSFVVDGDLTDKQRRLIQLEAAKILANPPEPEKTVTPEAVKEWSALFDGIGKGLASTAKEMGIAVNEFAKSPVGILTILLAVWHYAGQDLVQIIFGFIWLSFLVPLWVWMFRTRGSVSIKSDTRYEKGEGPGGKRRVIEYETGYNDAVAGQKVVYWITLIAIFLIGVLAIVV